MLCLGLCGSWLPRWWWLLVVEMAWPVVVVWWGRALMKQWIGNYCVMFSHAGAFALGGPLDLGAVAWPYSPNLGGMGAGWVKVTIASKNMHLKSLAGIFWHIAIVLFRLAGAVLVCIVIVWLTGPLELLSLLEAADQFTISWFAERTSFWCLNSEWVFVQVASSWPFDDPNWGHLTPEKVTNKTPQKVHLEKPGTCLFFCDTLRIHVWYIYLHLP